MSTAWGLQSWHTSITQGLQSWYMASVVGLQPWYMSITGSSVLIYMPYIRTSVLIYLQYTGLSSVIYIHHIGTNYKSYSMGKDRPSSSVLKSQHLDCIMSQFIPVYSLNNYLSIHFLISTIYSFIYFYPLICNVLNNAASTSDCRALKDSTTVTNELEEVGISRVAKFKVLYWHLSGGTKVNNKLQSRIKPGTFWKPVRNKYTSANFLSLIFMMLQVLNLNLMCTHSFQPWTQKQQVPPEFP